MARLRHAAVLEECRLIGEDRKLSLSVRTDAIDPLWTSDRLGWAKNRARSGWEASGDDNAMARVHYA